MQSLKRCSCPNNSLFVFALVSWIWFLCFELFLRIYSLYRHAPLVDVPSHFFAGIAIFASALWYFSLTSVWNKRAWSFVVVLAAALLWEIFEKLQELVVYNPPFLVDVFFWDGFGDVLVTLTGGLAGLGILLFIKRSTRWIETEF
ncbi:MAG: hypothetical protein ABIF10_02850 [Candidatus Woesearchaeota archaeon]